MKNQAEMIGELIREARNAKDLTVRDLAKALDLSPGAISNLENGKVQKLRPEYRQKLLDVLGVELPEDTSEGEELDTVFKELEIEPIQQELFRRALGGTVAKRRQGGNKMGLEQLMKKVASVLPVMPNATVLKLSSPEVVAAMDFLNIVPSESYRSNVNLVLDDIESIIFDGIQTDGLNEFLPEQDQFLNKLAEKCNASVHFVSEVADEQEQLKKQLIADGFLSMAMEVDEAAEDAKYFGAVATNENRLGGYEYCLLLSATTQEKDFRKLFTFAHELAHIFVDPGLRKGSTVHRYRGTSGQNSLEWFIDQVAGRILFPSFWMKPRIAHLTSNGTSPILSPDVVSLFRRLYTPHASYQAVVNALVNYWPIPVLYLEAKRHRVTLPGNPPRELICSFTVYYTSRNQAAFDMNLVVPSQYQIPTESALCAFYDDVDRDPGTSDVTDVFSGEALSIWQRGMKTVSNGVKLHITCIKTKRRNGIVVVKAFLMPLQALLQPSPPTPN